MNLGVEVLRQQLYSLHYLDGHWFYKLGDWRNHGFCSIMDNYSIKKLNTLQLKTNLFSLCLMNGLQLETLTVALSRDAA